MNIITITAVDRNSSDTMSRSFETNGFTPLKYLVEGWEETIPYRKYELMTPDFIEDYEQEVVDTLEELEVNY